MAVSILDWSAPTVLFPLSLMLTAAMLAIAALLDYWIGDPWNWLHPVQIMGWIIERYTELVLRRLEAPLARRIAGVFLGILTIALSGLLGWLVVWLAAWIHPIVAMAIGAVTLASCFAGRSLRAAAADVLEALAVDDLPAARSRLSRYVGRDTAELSRPDILRAVLETVTENAIDGVMAPLFYAIVGAFLPCGAVPLALAYKASSTLDSMVGYKEAPYLDLGWFSARCDDLLTWFPCRLTVLTLSLLSGKPREVWWICWRDAPHDPSPNAGWSECAYAAVLGVQLGGTNSYKGVIKNKPLLGDPIRSITPERIEQALQLTRLSFLIWLVLAILGLLFVDLKWV